MPRPLIGINCTVEPRPSGGKRLALNLEYVQAVEDALGVPVLLPWQASRSLASALDAVQGVVLIGGDDLDPAVYGQLPHPETRIMDPQRQAFDLALASRVLERRLPVLGICFGCQLLNVARGGSLIQHLEGHRSGRHRVSLEPGSRVSRILGGLSFQTNSFHHQAVAEPGRGLEIVGRSADGVVEAFEDPGHPFLVGVQWHPEYIARERPEHARLFRALVSASVRRKCNSTKEMKRRWSIATTRR